MINAMLFRLAPSWQTTVFEQRCAGGPRDAKTAHWARDGLGLTEPHAESQMTWRARSAAEPWPAYSQNANRVNMQSDALPARLTVAARRL